MSAMSVMGEKRTESLLLYDCPEFDKEAREKCGAYILKFWINSNWMYVIVDNILPFAPDGKLLLG